MSIRRAVPDIHTDDMRASSEFYERLGFRVDMDMGWVRNLVSPSNPTAQVILYGKDATAPVNPDLSVEVEDVDAVHAAMRAAGGGDRASPDRRAVGRAALLRAGPERHGGQRPEPLKTATEGRPLKVRPHAPVAGSRQRAVTDRWR
ncbi:VOC family protein [Actinomadura madurae]|uniref:VOC family protein n=1 Tax=Actinomadura madurae TaxID=1993 RepID=UPI0027E37E63|nr:VOC family protein [Actinomadura madurae]